MLRDAEDPCRFGAVGCSAQRTLLFCKLVVSRICSANVGPSRHRSNAGLAFKHEFPDNEPLLASNELKCACWANVRVELRETWEIMTWFPTSCINKWGSLSPDWPYLEPEGFASSLTLGRVRPSAPRFRAGASDCDKVCHLTQIPPDVPAMSALFQIPLWLEIQSLPCRVMHGEGISVASRPQPNVPSRASTWSGRPLKLRALRLQIMAEIAATMSLQIEAFS